MEKVLWWGYKHINGSFQAKRYLDPLDIYEAQESPFVRNVVGPFESGSRDEALKLVEEKVKQNDQEI